MGVGLGSLVSGQLVARYGHYTAWLRAGALLVVVGVGMLATLTRPAAHAQVVSCLAVYGLGLGPIFPLTMLAVQNAAAPAQLGQATTAMQFGRQLGSVLIAALLGAVLTLALARAWPTTVAPPVSLETGGAKAVTCLWHRRKLPGLGNATP